MTERKRLGEISHTNPYTDKSFGETTTYRRGPVLATDGGRDPEREAESDTEVEEDADDDTLRDIDHEPPDGEGTQATYERGNEGRDAVR